MKTYLLIYFILSLNAFANTPLICDESKSPLFQNEEVLELEIMLDIRGISTTNDNLERSPSKQYPAVLSYINKGVRVNIPAAAIIKGGVRSSCEFPPLKFLFEKEEVSNNFQNPLDLYGLMRDKISNTIGPFLGFKQKNNIFKKLGKKIRLVSHCGKSEYDWLSANNKYDQEQRLLLEYYLYKLLDSTKSTTLKTRLARTKYIDASGKLIDISYSFFRESSKDVAKRCGLKTEIPFIDKPIKQDQGSHIQLEWLEYLASNTDYGIDTVLVDEEGNEAPTRNNVYKLYDSKNNEFYAPYDFDLAELWYEESFDSSFSGFAFNEVSLSLAESILNKKLQIEETISSSLLSAKLKYRMINHINKTMNYLSAYKLD